MKFCKTCTMPDTRPRLRFDENGICSACHYHFQVKPQIDWLARGDEFREIMDAQPGPFHCVVPFSGGKDSSYVALRIKEMGYSPLAVCYGQLLPTERGMANIRAIQEVGITVIHVQPDQAVSRDLSRRFLVERGHPKQHYDSAVNATTMKIAMAMGIDLIVFGEHGETEYGGHILSEKSSRERDLAEVLENQVGDDAANWFDDPCGAEAWPYTMPIRLYNPKEPPPPFPTAVYFSYFFPWDTKHNYEYVAEHSGWRPEPFDSDGNFVNYDSIDDMIDDLDYYMMYIKFGFGRATRQANRLLHWGHMSRRQAVAAIKTYDGQQPRRYIPQILNYLDMNFDELLQIVEKHRNPNVFEKNADGFWELKNKIWDDDSATV